MSKIEYSTLPSVLRNRLRRFLNGQSVKNRPIVAFFQTLVEREWRAVFFGGLLRDLMHPQLCCYPRDVDLVVSGVTTAEIERAYSGVVRRRTRFGGLQLDIAGYPVDIWPLEETWGIRQLGLAPTFDNLPKTTFLNVEAIAVDLTAANGSGRRIYSAGFFEAIVSKRLSINLKENPYPALCIVRSLITAAKLEFAISSDLAYYVISEYEKCGIEELLQVQQAHYQRSVVGKDELVRWLVAVQTQYDASTSMDVGIRLPVDRQRQLELCM